MLVDGYKNSAQSPDGAACKVRRDTGSRQLTVLQIADNCNGCSCPQPSSALRMRPPVLQCRPSADSRRGPVRASDWIIPPRIAATRCVGGRMLSVRSSVTACLAASVLLTGCARHRLEDNPQLAEPQPITGPVG